MRNAVYIPEVRAAVDVSPEVVCVIVVSVVVTSVLVVIDDVVVVVAGSVFCAVNLASMFYRGSRTFFVPTHFIKTSSLHPYIHVWCVVLDLFHRKQIVFAFSYCFFF